MKTSKPPTLRLLLGLLLLPGAFVAAADRTTGRIPGVASAPTAAPIQGALPTLEGEGLGNIGLPPATTRDLDLQNIPLYFITNEGQVDEKALFYVQTPHYTLWLTKQGLIFDSWRRSERRDTHSTRLPPDPTKNGADHEHDRAVSSLVFLNATTDPEIVALEDTKHRVNYFLGSDKSKWRSNVSTSRAVLYKDLYPNIDLKVYGVAQQIEYDFVVRPGGNVANIRFSYDNVFGTRLDNTDNLLVETGLGTLRHIKPTCYQMIEGRKIQIDAEFRRVDDTTYGFTVAEYSTSSELFIDPLVMVHSSYLGGSGWENGHALAVDSEGSAYVTGFVESSTDFPTRSPIQQTFAGGFDIFIAKVDATGRELVYSTYLGGSRRDLGLDIAVDSHGATYVTGLTESDDFPTTNALQGSYGGWEDAFIAKIDPSGGSLIFSTYLGGSGFGGDAGTGIALDSGGAVYVTGATGSVDFPVRRPLQRSLAGGSDCFIAKVDSSGTALIYATYFGGSDADYCNDIALDTKGAVYVTGDTHSRDFPTRRPIQADHAGNADTFIAKLKPSGTSLTYSTYLGGLLDDVGRAIAVAPDGAAYITGYTHSRDFPTANAIQSTSGGQWDAFVTKVSPSGRAIDYSTYLGGSQWDLARGLAVDVEGRAYVVGGTDSIDFPTHNPAQEALAGPTDVFVAQLSPAGTSFVYSTYLGGSDEDGGQDIAVTSQGPIYVTGQTESVDFPTRSPIQATHAGLGDAFIVRAKIDGSIRIVSWNVLGYPHMQGDSRQEHFRSVLRVLDPDILVVQEMASAAAVRRFLRTVLNPAKPRLYKAAAFSDGPDTDNALFYKKKSFELVGQQQIATSFRDISEYRMRIKKGITRGTTLRLYSVHFSEGAEAEQDREGEARMLRDYLDGEPAGELVLVCGSFNMMGSTEPAFEILTGDQANNSGRLMDPIQELGDWRDNAVVRRIHTESTRKKAFGGGTGGGMDDRFDLILVSHGLEEDENLIYSVAGYSTCGNDGRHLNKSINKPRNRVVGREVADALYGASDHLPVIIDLVPQE